jgi:hypothetical protein
MNGVSSGNTGTTYDYMIESTGVNEDSIRYLINWGDSTNYTTTFYSYGKQVTVSHTWNSEGTFTISAIAEDENGLKREVNSLEISMTKDKSKKYTRHFLPPIV